jgi:hypothetical protein
MKRKLIFPDGTFIVGIRTLGCMWEEPFNCLRVIVIDASPELKELIGQKVTAHEASLKCWYTV